MAFNGEYVCTQCGKQENREMLVVKKVQFQELGVLPTTLRSRSVAWLCPSCVAADADWNQELYSSPGLRPRKQRNNPRLNDSPLYRRIKDAEGKAQAV